MREQTTTIGLPDLPSLTVIAGAGVDRIEIAGTDSSTWRLRLVWHSAGASPMDWTGSMLFVGRHDRSAVASLVVDAPADAPVAVHADESAVEVRNMRGPIAIAAPRGRVTVLKSARWTSVTGMFVECTVLGGVADLHAEGDITLDLEAGDFAGRIAARARQGIRFSSPADSQPPLSAVVGRGDQFIDRAGAPGRFRREDRGRIYYYSAGVTTLDESSVHLSSDESTITIATKAVAVNA